MENLQEYRTMTSHKRRSGVLRMLDAICGCIENVLIFLSASAIIVAMFVTFLDVVLRYVFKSPVSWVFDFITMYLLPGSYFLAFSYALRTGNHLKVDYFIAKFPKGFRSIAAAAFGFVAVDIFVFVSYTYSVRAFEAWEQGEVIYGAVNWAVWPSSLIIAASAAVFSLRLLISIFRVLVKAEAGAL